MVYRASHQSMFVIWLACSAIWGSGIATGPETDAGEVAPPEGRSWQQQIAELESRLFDPILSPAEVDRLLGEWENAETRPEAASRLAEQGQGHIDRVIAFARRCPDMEARQACVEIVEALDASYRTTKLGKQLGALYRQHAEALLPAYWARFRNDPLDPRAVAMLMHADAAATYGALDATGDRHDPLRYLLLRIRELSPDEFARKHVFEHTASGARLVMADVFPFGAYKDGPRVYGRVHRTVGQTHLGVFRLCSAQDFDAWPGDSPSGLGATPDGLPGIQLVQLGKRWLCLFHHSIGVYYLQTGGSIYSRQGIHESGRRFSVAAVREGLCPLPYLGSTCSISEYMSGVPRWIRQHVPEEYHATFRYSEAMPGEEAPELIAADPVETPLLAGRGCAVPPEPLNPAAPTVVILPPRLSSRTDMSVRVAAELACDRLAQEIVAAGLARVVDRQELDRLLRERGLAAEPPRPMVSFDAMLRLDVDSPALVPTARLSVIDLAHGNPVSEAEYGWPLREKDVPELVSQCREALGQMETPKDGRLRMRCFDVENPDRNPRLAPLAARLGQVFEQVVARSPGLVHVRHLEAGSAKEESLLLLMGLSRLPGGRRFVPQADATIELSVREGNGRGKKFEETPVEIVVVIDRAGKADAQSLVIHGTVATFDDAIARAWHELSEVLREVQPAAAAEWFGDMAVRRRQAEAELRAARAIQHEEPDTRDVQKLLARVAHAEAALKLDPAFEDAACEHLAALCNLCFRTFTRAPPAQVEELAERILTHAVRYFEQFGPETEHHSDVYGACRIAVRTSFGTFGSSSNLSSTSRTLQTIRHAKWILEHALRHHGRASADGDHARVLLIVGRAMRQAGIAQDECEAWVDSLLRQCRLNEADWTDAGDVSREHVLRNSRIWFRAAELAVEDGNMDRAQRLIAELQGRLASSPKTPAEIELRRLRSLMVMMDDAPALAEFQRWAVTHDKRVVQLVELRWPAIDVFPPQDRLDHRSEHTGVELGGISVRSPSQTHPNEFRPISPLAEGERRLYVVGGDEPIGWQQFRRMSSVSRSQAIGYIPLDDAGGPAGEGHHASGADCNASWHAPTWLRPPEVTAPLHVLDARCFAGRLYLGTLQTGLLVFDPKAETWSSFTVEEGLPEKAVAVIHPLDERTLFCVGQSDLGQPVCYTLTLPEGKVTLRHRANGANFNSMPTLLWRDGEALRAWTGSGLYMNLLAEHAAFVRPDCEVPYGWSAVGGALDTRHCGGFASFAEVNGRRFVTNAGLHEVDSKGMILRTWRGQCDYKGDYGRAFSAPLPPGCPIQAMDMVNAGGLLVFVDRESVLAWDPKTDTWYGPLDTAPTYYALGAGAGVWLAMRDRMVFLSTGNILATAGSAGRVMTTHQYQQRQQEVIAAMRPLDRAKVAYSMRQFGEAKQLAQTVLKDDPECVEALLLMGYLHDLWSMNQPETALEYYHRLAKLESDRNASFTGMYRRFVLLRTRKRWAEALATIDAITDQFPRLHESQQDTIDWWRNHIQKQLAETGGNQPVAETSKKTERPGN